MTDRVIKSWISTFLGLAIGIIATFYLSTQFETLTIERAVLYVIMYALAISLIFAKDKLLGDVLRDILNKKL
jgi:hypothetical protein